MKNGHQQLLQAVFNPRVLLASGFLFAGLAILTAFPAIAVAAPPAAAIAKLNLDTPDFESNQLDRFETQIHQTYGKVQHATVGLGSGSGVVVSPDGLVLTVAHVANHPGRRLRVTFSDGKRAWASVLGTCDELDIAVAKINGDGPWPSVAISRVDLPPVGSWLLKVGYPVSFSHGKPPAVRVGQLLRDHGDAFISDCPIMGGDSGGPIFDLEGNLVGISSRCQDKINYNVHVPLSRFYNNWEQLCSGVELTKFHDGKLFPKRPRWEEGYGQSLAAQKIPFPGEIASETYAARKPATPATTNRRRSPPLPLGRQDAIYLKGLAVAQQAARKVTSQVLVDDVPAASGTLLWDAPISKHQSFIATKASLLGIRPQNQQISVRLPGEKTPRAATWVGDDSRTDLAILAIDYQPEWASESDSTDEVNATKTREIQPGVPVLTVTTGGKSLVGFVSATPRSFSLRQPPLVRNRAMLGVSVSGDADGVRITNLVEDSGAAKAGLEVGDIVLRLDGKIVRSADELVSVIALLNVGDTIEIHLKRETETQQVTATLGAFTLPAGQRNQYDNWGGGPFSDRRFEIPHVLPHDTPLPPEECGSPLVDHHGQVLGVNISRALRTTSYALPIEDVWHTIERLQQL